MPGASYSRTGAVIHNWIKHRRGMENYLTVIRCFFTLSIVIWVTVLGRSLQRHRCGGSHLPRGFVLANGRLDVRGNRENTNISSCGDPSSSFSRPSVVFGSYMPGIMNIGGRSWSLHMGNTETIKPHTNTVGSETSEDEQLKVTSRLGILFERCMRTCDNSDFQSTVKAVTEYMKAYETFFSRFFEEPVELPVSTLVDASVQGNARSVDPDNDLASGTDDHRTEAQTKDKKRNKHSESALSYEYTEDTGSSSDGCRRWHVAAKPRVPREFCRLIVHHRKRCVGIMGRMMRKVSTLDDLRTVTIVCRDASRLGIDVLKGMYEAMSMIHAKFGRTDKALEYIERMWSAGERRRYRSYEPLLTYFEEHWDGEGMLRVLHHIVEKAKLPVSGLIFTRVLVTICLSVRNKLFSLGHDASGTTAVSGTHPEATVLQASPTICDMYATLRRQLSDALDIYQKHSCNRISLSSRLGYAIFSVFSKSFPNVVKFTHVSPVEPPISSETIPAGYSGYPNTYGSYGMELQSGSSPNRMLPAYNETHGSCASCEHQVPLLDLSDDKRLFVFTKWLQHIYDYNYPEIIRLANFYAWLHAPLREGQGYTCVLDGQNIGYNKRESMSPMNLRKIDAVLQVMLQRGERPFIILPYYARTKFIAAAVNDTLGPDTLDLLFPGNSLGEASITLSNSPPPRAKRHSADEAALIDHWYSSRQAYFCESRSYDDNYFFLANVMTGRAEELEVLARFVKSSLELSLSQKTGTYEGTVAANLPKPKVEDYLPTLGRPPHRPVMMTVTNDTLTNLDIPGVDEDSLRILRDIPLTPYFFTSDPGLCSKQHVSKGVGSYRVVVGERLRYSLEMNSSGCGKYHIPLGYERKVIDYRARHTVWVTGDEQPRIEPPLSGAYLDSSGHPGETSDPNNDQELKQVNTWLENHGYSELLYGLGEVPSNRGSPRRYSRRYAISTKAPEIIKQKFNPSQETRWLCIDLTALDRIQPVLMMSFFEKVAARAQEVGAPLCLGLDPRNETIERFSHTGLYTLLYDRYVSGCTMEGFRSREIGSLYVKLKLYCCFILESTAQYVCCVKPNLAFFLAHGAEGIQVLMDICEVIRGMNLPLLLDAKLGDIGSTMEYYKKFIFEILKADSCTVNTLLGTDVLSVMATDRQGQYVHDLFVLAKCSNPSSEQIQGATLSDLTPVYLEIIKTCESFYKSSNVTTAKVGYVVGATCVDVLAAVRQAHPDCVILMPGVGAQGGDLGAAMKAALSKEGTGVIVPISRAIIDAPNPAQAALHWKDQIKACLPQA
ncbi:Orotidine 5'-phosphate decarboxylase [Babesia sp. Xinjiang]|uniref:Orotidine 5'-phosphate decarboxylase n=1 Tax=Babesia sp. Xinjiang TaxID=462227 RepID=UPI000A25FE6D|nr:Orotidine 5'-phosphate decarboxylase [Babesia sp. Xinjiang]ORM39565.1 Orotidine 5'-phosphate decarboxylase [Babesia sp. Xinjiang]